MINKIIGLTILVYAFSCLIAMFIMKTNNEYRDNIVDDSLSFEDQQFSTNMIVYCPILNTLLVLSYLWFFLKWLFKIK